MKTKILVVLLVTMLMTSTFLISYADETVNETTEIELSVESVEEAAADDDAVQQYTIPILRDSDAISQVENSDASLFGVGGLIINNVSTQDFYADCETFKIQMYARDGLMDARSKLKLSVVDEDETVIARQIDVYYNYETNLYYEMELVAPIEEGKNYFVSFAYTGSYTITLPSYSTIRPVTDPAIKDIEILDEGTNSFVIYLANSAVGEEYTLFYGYGWGSEDVKIDATVEDGKLIFATFGPWVAFNNQNYITLCEAGAETTDWQTRLDDAYIGNFIDYNSNSNSSWQVGSCDDLISTNENEIYIWLFQKSFNYEEFSADDLSVIDAYLFDLTAGETVGTLTSKDYREEYRQIEGTITINRALNENHKYVMVFNDGCSLTTYDEFEITSQAKMSSIWVRAGSSNGSYSDNLPVGASEIYVMVGTVNISDYNNIAVTLMDSTGRTVAVGGVNRTGVPLRVPQGLAEGDYIIKATYRGMEIKKEITVGLSAGEIYQNVRSSASAYNGKTYITLQMNGNAVSGIDVRELSYKVILPDGRECDATFHREFPGNTYNRIFVVTVNEELSGLSYNNPAMVEIYNGNSFMEPMYPDNMNLRSVQSKPDGFFYSNTFEEDGNIIFYAEGLSPSKTYTVIAYDEVTQKYVSVDADDVTYNTITFDRESRQQINTYCGIMEYSSNSQSYIEQDGVLLGSIWQSIATVVFEDDFGFRDTQTKYVYNVLDLPFKKYAYYKVASSESALASTSYKQIKVGELYQIPNVDGTHTVYAQFKTASGQESEVQSTSITLDRTVPTFEITTAGPYRYLVDEYNRAEISLDYTASESGMLYYAFYDADGNMIGYDDYITIPVSGNNFSFDVYTDNYPYEDAVKMELYLEDRAGNRSEKIVLDVSIISLFTDYISGDTIITINTETGIITNVSTNDTKVIIPSQIKGIAVVGIDEYAFEYNESYLEIVIPASVLSIDEYAFWELNDFKLYVKENSPAHSFAIANDIDFEITRFNPGDINEDDSTNIQDVIMLLKHVNGSQLMNDTSMCDLNNDGRVNIQDVIRLLKHVNNSEPLY